MCFQTHSCRPWIRRTFVATFAKHHDLASIWRGDGSEFDVSVTTIFVVLADLSSVEAVQRYARSTFVRIEGPDIAWRNGSWAPLVSTDVESVDVLTLNSNGTLKTFCEITADYRDQYYGLVGAVYDDLGNAVSATDGDPPLLTTGLIDPLLSQWGKVTTRFNKVRYLRPRVQLSALSPSMQSWAKSRLRPKLLVATQGRMPEVVIDGDGRWLPCVPVISVFELPNADVNLESLAAILLSPASFEYLRLTKLGSGLGSDALKVSSADLRALPAPANLKLTADAALLLPDLAHHDQRDLFRRMMNEAFGLADNFGARWEDTIVRYLERSVSVRKSWP